MDGQATGPGPPFPHHHENNDVKRSVQLWRKNLGECRSGTENDQPNARTRDLVASTRLVVPMTPQTMEAASMWGVEQQLPDELFEDDARATKRLFGPITNTLELLPLCSVESLKRTVRL